MTKPFYILEIHFYAVSTRMQFPSKRKAENARRKITDHMGKFRNEDSIVEIRSETSSQTVDCREVKSVVVLDGLKWNAEAATQHAYQKQLEADIAKTAN